MPGGLALGLVAIMAIMAGMAGTMGMGGCKQRSTEPTVDEAANVTKTQPSSAESAAVAASAAAEVAKPADHSYAKQADYTLPSLSTLEMPNGLVIEELKIGTGAFCLPKAFVTFHYRSKVKDGAEFDATAERPNGPAPQTASLDKLMQGLQDGMVGMKSGGRRRITIPADLAFSWLGAKNPEGKVVVEPDTAVVFVVDLMDVKQALALPPADRSVVAPTPDTPPAK